MPAVTNANELEVFLTTHFPHWHMFPSCRQLSQKVWHQDKTSTTKQWIDKYHPCTIDELLGGKHNFNYLKDWLHHMKIEPLSAPSSTTGGAVKKRRKKKVVIQHDFTLDDIGMDDDDDEAFLRNLSLQENDTNDDEDFLLTPHSQKRKQLKKELMRSNILLLVGDHGIGKTASVYTAAQQLDYEVFEINAGSRRAGKDIMSMVGEMTKSHLVAFGIAPPSSSVSLYLDHPSATTTTSTKTSKRKKLNPCFSPSMAKSHQGSEKNGLLKHFLRKKEPATPLTPSSLTTPPTTKQSLILLEEVDLLFEEDKGFWTSVIELSQKSKRPIIMTCNDPDQIPFENLYIQMVLNLKPPPESELLPYLWLVCFAEGYLVDPVDLICLMAFLGRDIRQLLQTLEMYARENIFGRYLGIENGMDETDVKLRSVPSNLAIDTFRLARYYEGVEEQYQVENEDDDFDTIVQALENNAFIDTWFKWKGNPSLVITKEEVEGL
ncbi:MAG: P-loop containing nucleoside triphosphate hydrolase protein [Benjaminiella poitrasii]|nr:MAG: P-loop containing nucleoside triphosphate hydrolase protein [Benjaminiella poitrasii]